MAYQPTILPPVLDQRKRRSCLRCDTMFLSNSPAHRRCKRCTNQLQGEPSPERTYRVELWNLR
jgi:uncharacterized paraquat-inducible protein A